MRGGKSSGKVRKASRSYVAHNPSPPLAIRDESSPTQSPILTESSIPNANGSSLQDPILQEGSSPALSSPTDDHVNINENDEESLPIQPISNPPIHTKPYIEVHNNT